MSEYTPKQWELNNMVTKTKIEKLKALVNELSEYLDSDEFEEYVENIAERVVPTADVDVKRVDCVVEYSESQADLTAITHNFETFEEFVNVYKGTLEPNPMPIDGIIYCVTNQTAYRLVFIQVLDDPVVPTLFVLYYLASDEFSADIDHTYCAVYVTSSETGGFNVTSCEFVRGISPV